MHDYAYMRLAIVNLPLLQLVALVAIVSCAVRSRLAFVAGALGCFLGYAIPIGVYRVSGWGFFSALTGWHIQARHMIFYGVMGALVGCGSVVCYHLFNQRLQLQFSIRSLLLFMLACSVIISMYKSGWPMYP